MLCSTPKTSIHFPALWGNKIRQKLEEGLCMKDRNRNRMECMYTGTLLTHLHTPQAFLWHDHNTIRPSKAKKKITGCKLCLWTQWTCNKGKQNNKLHKKVTFSPNKFLKKIQHSFISILPSNRPVSYVAQQDLFRLSVLPMHIFLSYYFIYSRNKTAAYF